MSEIDDSPEDSGNVAAAEYVLGVLSAADRADVERRLPRDPILASEVAFWEERLGSLANSTTPVTPPPETWTRIEDAVSEPSARKRESLWESLAFWRPFAIGSAALAAASLGVLVYVGLAPSPNAPMMATLGGSSGQPNFVAAVGADGRSLMVVPAALLTNDQRAMELWLIPSGGRPHSLGLIEPGRPVRLNVPADLRARLNGEATLAVTLEQPGGSPTGLPTSAPFATGKLTSL